MPGIATFAELKQRSNKIESRVLLKQASTKRYGATVFLSHSSKDSEYLPGIVEILEDHGGKVYTDVSDDRLTTTPTRETANILRKSVHDCRKFVLFVTTVSKQSKWIPWELGLADGDKEFHSIALFPAANYSYEETWLGTEYLGLYKRIIWGQMESHNYETWIVYNNQNNQGETLNSWLKG